MALQETTGRFSFLGTQFIGRQETVGRFGFIVSIQIVALPSPQTTVGGMAFAGSVLLSPRFYPAVMPIVSGSPTGVVPQQGSGIYESWAQEQKTPIFIHEHWDKHHSGRARFDDTRRSWSLHVRCTKTKATEILTFINDHLGAGKSFYFYDLQANGFQYDATGVLTDGRYTVRFMNDAFPRRQNYNNWFEFDLPIIEVE